MKRNKIMIIGSGRLGASIATKLSEDGEDVYIIDKNQDSFRKLQDTFSGYEIVGDATDLAVLDDSGIKMTKMVVITTDNDNVNIYLSHICYYIYNVPNIYIRLNDSDKGALLEGTSVKVIYPFKLSLQEFTRLNDGGDNL
jgi:trk system potassium uptake protein